ncbi:thiamine-phosphate pyrophosphorylase [candidate division WOR-3 bacterium]|nr:thiamine-phosphate pyrophosphorylase [candidate division WOR-3 bacterium]
MTDLRTARIIDVNLNRLTEGLRVVEDVVRLALEDRRLLVGIRRLRTQVGKDVRTLRRQVISSRKSETDLGRGDRFDRTKRKSLVDVLLANFKRAEESARVLEEVLKVSEPGLAGKFKAVRFRLYDFERAAVAASADLAQKDRR